MQKQEKYRKPGYFFAVFGDPSDAKPEVDSGYYPHKGYISSLGMVPGDIMLLYCTEFYAKHFMEAPGIGVVVSTTEECVYYQYFPLDRPMGWDTIKESLKDYANRLQNLGLRGDWLFKIDSAAFRNAAKERQIDWP